ncbi:MAG: tetratricopeptide repeat protein [Candidatus Omnitrophota bacterium]
MGKRKGIALNPVFLRVGRFAARARMLSGKATHFMAKEFTLLDIKKSYLAEKLLHTDILYLRKFVEVKPQSADTHYNLGSALMNRGRFNEAAFYFKKAALWNFHHIRAYLGMAKAYLHLQRYDESIEALEKAITYDGKNAEIQYKLSIAYDKKGTRDKAVDSLKRALELRPDFEKAKDALSLLEEDSSHK